jgi:hypothetical protein
MEIIDGVIKDWEPDGTIHIDATVKNLDVALKREYSRVQVAIDDGRRITPEQRRKAYVLLKFIADWMGEYPEPVKEMFKWDFVLNRMEAMEKKLFSLSDCSETTAREFISFLIDFIVEHGISCGEPLWKLSEDIGRYVYRCVITKRCCICGLPGDLHHVDGSRIGMGGNRNEVNHLGRECLPLCRVHHGTAHTIGDREFMERYHLVPVKIDKDICRKYGLKK